MQTCCAGVGVDRHRPDRHTETIAEGEEAASELSHRAVGTQHRQVGGHVLDLGVSHGPLESGPVSRPQRLRNDEVDPPPDGIAFGMAGERLRTAVSSRDHPVCIDRDHSVSAHPPWHIARREH